MEADMANEVEVAEPENAQQEDLESGISILDLLRDVTRDGERSVLIVTHNAVTARMADRVIRLRDGQITSQETNPSPADPEQLDW